EDIIRPTKRAGQIIRNDSSPGYDEHVGPFHEPQPLDPMQYLSRYPEKDPSQPFRQETTFARLLRSIAPLFGNCGYVVSGHRIFRDRAQACDPCVGHAFRRVTDDGVQGALVAQGLRAKIAEEDDLSLV